MTRRSVLGLTACGVLTLAAACSTGGTTQEADTATPTPSPSTTTAPPSATATPTVPPAATSRSVHVYFLRGEHLVSVHRSVSVTSGAVASAAITSLLAGPTTAERSAGMSTTVPAGTKLLGVSISNGLGTVDLSGAYASGGGSLSMSARLAQVVYTMTQFATVQRVNFKLDGKAVTVFSGEGIILDHPATRAQYAELLPPIFIDSPAVGETVTSPVRVQGLANVFEGQFSVDVVDGSGRVLATRPATAAMGEFRAFTVTIPYTVAQPGPGKVVGWDASAKDGSRIDEWPVPVTLR
jgi:germination protein M